MAKRDVEALRERLKARRARYVEGVAQCRDDFDATSDVTQGNRILAAEMRYDARVAEIDVVLDTIKEWL